MHASVTGSPSLSMCRSLVSIIILTDTVRSLRMKALLFAIVRFFEFELAVEPEDIVRRTNVVGRPFIDSNIEAGSQLPLLIRLVKG